MKINENGVVREMTAAEVAEYKAMQDDFVRQYWENVSYEDAVNDIIRGTCPAPVTIPGYTTYTLSNELAILRQKAEKPEEYNGYFKSCEAAKNYAKEMKAKYTPKEV